MNITMSMVIPTDTFMTAAFPMYITTITSTPTITAGACGRPSWELWG